MKQIVINPEDSVMQDFKTLQACRDYKSCYTAYETKSYEAAVSRLQNKFHLGGLSLQLLSELLRSYPYGLRFDNVHKSLRMDWPDYTREVETLKKEGLIRITVSSNNNHFMFLTLKAASLFRRSRYLSKNEEFDFVEEIRCVSQQIIKASPWLDDFELEIAKRKDSDFSKGWKDLGISELPTQEKNLFCILLKHFVHNYTNPFEIDNDNRETPDLEDFNFEFERVDNREAQNLDNLVQKGLAVKLQSGYSLSPDVAEDLLNGHDEIVKYDEISSIVSIIKDKDIEKKELFFSDESREEIENLGKMLSPAGFKRACSILVAKKREPAILSLLWGGPGTGKTETVKQIALNSGRDIFLFDVAKVTASDWGATENLYRDLFRAYRYIVAVKKIVPILLINEADQVLSKRLLTMDRAIDKSENIVSNILLQELEDMHGILMATTNLGNILDEAFDRRFMFKTELKKPDKKAQAKIWKSMAPDLSEEECGQLSEKFDMSGAQISNVAAKRDIAELYFDGNRGIEFIADLCQKELASERMTTTKSVKIGFGS